MSGVTHSGACLLTPGSVPTSDQTLAEAGEEDLFLPSCCPSSLVPGFLPPFSASLASPSPPPPQGTSLVTKTRSSASQLMSTSQRGPCPWPQWCPRGGRVSQAWPLRLDPGRAGSIGRGTLLCLLGSCEPGLLERLLEPLMLLSTQRSRLTCGLQVLECSLNHLQLCLPRPAPTLPPISTTSPPPTHQTWILEVWSPIPLPPQGKFPAPH